MIRKGKLSPWSVKRLKKDKQKHFITHEKVAKTFWFIDKDGAFLKGCKVLSQVSYPLLATYVKRVPFVNKR